MGLYLVAIEQSQNLWVRIKEISGLYLNRLTIRIGNLIDEFPLSV